MRRTTIMLFVGAVMIALCLTACNRDDDKDNGANNGVINGGGNNGGDSDHEYPSTAVVIRNAVKDIDGNTYDAVQIGNQVWMAENLKTTRYADGTSIPLGDNGNLETAYRYAPGTGQTNEENKANVNNYGYLYNWPAMMHGASSSDANPSGVQGICPTGWHVPSDAEWTQLTDYMKTQPIYATNGNTTHIAKALAAPWGWNSSDAEDAVGNDPTTNNASGFSAIPAGWGTGSWFEAFGYYANFWSATESDENYAYYYFMFCDHYFVGRYNLSNRMGMSVRCLRD